MQIVKCKNNKCGYCIEGNCRNRLLVIRANGTCGYMYNIFGQTPADFTEPKEFLSEMEKAEIEIQNPEPPKPLTETQSTEQEKQEDQ